MTHDDERWSQNLRVKGRTIAFKLDTGSDVNIISEMEYRTTTPQPRLEKIETVMTSYSGGPIPSLLRVGTVQQTTHICLLPLVNIKHLIIIIIIQHLFMRHISGHCGHSEAHYKHLHIINNIMIKMPTVKMQDKI